MSTATSTPLNPQGTPTTGQLTTNFRLEEFRCKDGTEVPAKLLSNVRELAKNLQVLRDYVGEPIYINSGYRTTAYNKSVGGKPSSRHLTAKAADITCKLIPAKELAGIIEKLIEKKKMKQGGIGTYPSFVHYDIRGIRARWQSC